MPKRRYEQREPTHDWQQIRPLLKDSAFRNWSLYGERGLAGEVALVNIFQDFLTLE